MTSTSFDSIAIHGRDLGFITCHPCCEPAVGKTYKRPVESMIYIYMTPSQACIRSIRIKVCAKHRGPTKRQIVFSC